MNRVTDIIKELEVQVEPLREQKIKALEYLGLNDELKDLCRLLVECKNSKLEEQLAKEVVEEPVVELEPIVEVADVEPEVEVEVLDGGDINEYKLED